MGDFNEKVVVVTGAGGGIGRASAIEFANQGAKLVVSDINESAINETAAMIGADALAVRVDVANEESCQAMIDKCVEAFGRVDVVFNNAAISGTRAKTHEQTSADWQRVIDINLNGVFYCTRAAIPEMQKTGGGVIVNTASVDGLVGMGSISHYTAAKHGVVGFTKAVALEYGPENIRCVSVCPGYIDTNMTATVFTPEEDQMLTSMMPLGRSARPEEVAHLVVWLASEKASYVTGSAHTVDAGLLAGFAL